MNLIGLLVTIIVTAQIAFWSLLGRLSCTMLWLVTRCVQTLELDIQSSHPPPLPRHSFFQSTSSIHQVYQRRLEFSRYHTLVLYPIEKS